MSNKLKKARAEAIANMGKLNDAALEEKREFTAEEQTQYDALDAEQKSLKGQIARAEIQADLDAEMKVATTAPIHAPVATKTVDAELVDDTEFPNLGAFLNAIKAGGTDPRLDIVSAQSMGNGSEGGFLVPKKFGEMITAFTPEMSFVRAGATVIPAGENPDAEISFPALDQSGDKGVYSGVVTTWVAEGAEIDETSFSLREIAMAPKAVAGFIAFSNKLLRNTAAASTLGTMLLRQAIAKAEEDAFIGGDGVGKPLGFLNHASAKAINRNTAATVKYIDLALMVQNHKGDMKEWVISQTLYSTIVSMEDGGGNLIFTNGVNGASPMMLGFPVRWSERTPTKGVKGDVMLLDLSYYYIKDGSGIVISASEHVQFTKDKTLFKVISNVDGQSSMNTTLKLENDETVSPFVILDVVAV